MRYGPTLAEYCDVFPAGPAAPVHVFIHGGYWRRFSARDHDFVVPQLVAAGLTVVVVNYALCPIVSLDEIVRQVRAAIAWTYGHAGEFGADPSRLTVSGHSAGGHLTAMALLTDWAGDYGLPADIIKGAVAISGLFDLGFVPYSYIQPKVQATWDQVARLSPIRHLPGAAPPLLVAVGGDETDEFRRQSRDFHAAWRVGGPPGRLSGAAGQAPSHRAGGAGAFRQRTHPGPGARGSRLTVAAPERGSVDVVGLGHGGLELLDREVGLASGGDDRRLAPGTQIDRHQHLAHQRRPARPPRRGGRRGSGHRGARAGHGRSTSRSIAST